MEKHQFQKNHDCKLQNKQNEIIGSWIPNLNKILLSNFKNQSILWIHKWTHWVTCGQSTEFDVVGRFPSNCTQIGCYVVLNTWSAIFATVQIWPRPWPEATVWINYEYLFCCATGHDMGSIQSVIVSSLDITHFPQSNKSHTCSNCRGNFLIFGLFCPFVNWFVHEMVLTFWNWFIMFLQHLRKSWMLTLQFCPKELKLVSHCVSKSLVGICKPSILSCIRQP
jgi:hypothetical protein